MVALSSHRSICSMFCLQISQHCTQIDKQLWDMYFFPHIQGKQWMRAAVGVTLSLEQHDPLENITEKKC